MKKLGLIILLFLSLTAQAEVFDLDSKTFIDTDGLIKQIPPNESDKSLAKPFTGKVLSADQSYLWFVTDGIKQNMYRVLDFGNNQKVYQKPDEKIYVLRWNPSLPEDSLFTGERLVQKQIRENTIVSTFQKYVNGVPEGPTYQRTRAQKISNHHKKRKPIIYLYPQEETEVNVKVGHPENLTHTYPKYVDGWHVLAEPNGDLTDIKTGRYLYALYWEGTDTTQKPTEDGFVVKGSDTIAFLEEKLAVLGLTEREVDEFIIYWLPKLENNPYNLIRFQTLERQNGSMPLDITPEPDTLIRVMMEYQPLNEKMDLPEQVLPPAPARTGFTVVEWGGTELK